MTQEEIVIKSLNMSLEDIEQYYTLIKEGIRNYLHKVLEGTTEEHPLECNVPLEFGAEGLSTLQMNHITGLFRDSEGIIWCNTDFSDPLELDNLYTEDQLILLKTLKDNIK